MTPLARLAGLALGLAVLLGAVTPTVAVAAPGTSAPAPRSVAATCADLPSPTTRDYLTGRQCPPAAFPYQPDFQTTRRGDRALDPFADGCSGFGVTEDQFWFDFNQACETHDYGYDLVRWGGTGLDEHDIDGFFRDDLKMACNRRTLLLKGPCYVSTEVYSRGVYFGTPRAKEGVTGPQGRVDVYEQSPFR